MSPDIDEVTLRSYPKVIFFWPTTLISALFGLFAQFIPVFNPTYLDLIAYEQNWNIDLRIILAIIWMGSFAANLFVTSFDFGSSKVLAMVACIVAGILTVIVLMAYFPNLGKNVTNFPINDFSITMSFWFYYAIAGLFALVFALTWLGKRFDYYKITSQEIVHKTGIFGDVERFPSPNIQIQKKITDMFEYVLLKSGELTIIPASRTTIIHLPTVLNINEKEKQIREVLGTLEVEIDRQPKE